MGIVFHPGLEEAPAIEQVAHDAKVAPTLLRGGSLTELFANRTTDLGITVFALGDGAIVPCGTAPLAPADIRLAIDTADQAVVEGDKKTARAQLDIAEAGLACLTEPVIAGDAGQIPFLRGVLAYQEGDLIVATGLFRQAHIYDDTIAWDPRFPSAARVTFDSAQPTAPFELIVVPAPSAPISVDGRPTTLVPPGSHVVQIGTSPVTTIAVQTRGTTTIVIPGLIDEGLAARVADPDVRVQLDRLFDAAAVHEDIYIAVAGDTWSRTAGGWAQLGKPAEPVKPPKPPKEHTALDPAPILANAGFVVVGLGVVATGVGFPMAHHQAKQADLSKGATLDDYNAHIGPFHTWRSVTYGGYALVGVGAALVVTSKVLPGPELSIGPEGASVRGTW